ncbi:hypothetical protein [Methylorubrum extorquens]|jgi:hypothetical protein|uniref:hypothetical protein n=1 Tax=Methylorubrum extorquens TaxID=408 RepID=UPI0001590B79|nr:hypothetical protein [Methylorubrum extorquens]ABY32899.1 hypothetical protein Mext_4531 [Methylorubrum extorquens PA1]KQP86139.1 hypothetical protein ASF55_13065 [Methylobacterium sp. Leaf119]WIU39486.1 hypothetical protein KQ926_23425 [Methylorubrum extorquens]
MDGIGIGIDWDETKEPAYRDGRRAGERREEAESNPHASGSDDHRLWQAGHASVTAPDVVADKIGDFA